MPFFILVVLVLGACSLIGRGNGDDGGGGGATIFGQEATLSPGPATLMCTQECSDRGFCGMLNEGAKVVLLSTAGPTTRNFDLFAADNTAVSIVTNQPQNATLQSDPQALLTVNYYVVNNAEIQQAWVVGWCVGQQQPLQ